MGKFGSPYFDKVTTAARTPPPVPTSSCSIFMYQNNWDFEIWVLRFFNMHTKFVACEHRKRVGTGSWLRDKKYIYIKSFAAPGNQACVSTAPGFSVGRYTNSASPPLRLLYLWSASPWKHHPLCNLHFQSGWLIASPSSTSGSADIHEFGEEFSHCF